MRRLFSTFAHGSAGIGLLLLRLAAGVAVVVQGVEAILPGPPLGTALVQAFSIGLGALLIAGLGTQIAAALLAIDALWHVFSSGHPWSWILLAAMSAALALLGPGAWSVDARLFGWKRLEFRDRKNQNLPPS
jgi:uncharacterized membrane protein YphA (DoxX/SURF4 family)